jgi:Spy/CpxP family protein refolding chaperone
MLKRTLLAALMAAAVVTPALAQPGPDGERGPRGKHECCMNRNDEQMPRHGEMMEMLKLTDQQKGQMEKLRTDLQKKQVTVQGKIAVLRIELKELFQAENPDRAAIEKKMKEVSDLQHQEKLNGLDHLFAVKAILTPEQAKMWKEHMLRMGEEGMGMGMMRGPKMGRGR